MAATPVYMIWYRTAQGKLKTTKINAKSKAEAIRKFKKTVRDTPPFRVLKLKAKTAAKKKATKRKATKRKTAKRRTAKKKRSARTSGEETKHTDIFVHGKKRKKAKKKGKQTRPARKRKKRKGASMGKCSKKPSMAGSKARDLTLIPKGDRAKAEAKKDKLKNNIIIYGNKNPKRKRGVKMPRTKQTDVMNLLIRGATGAAGGIAGGMAANVIPVPDQFKPFLPIGLGLAIPMLPIPLDKNLKEALSIGLITLGTAAALKKFFPNIPMIAGEDEITDADLDLLGLSENDMIEAQPEPIEDLLGEVLDISGEMMDVGQDFITSSDT